MLVSGAWWHASLEADGRSDSDIRKRVPNKSLLGRNGANRHRREGLRELIARQRQVAREAEDVTSCRSASLLVYVCTKPVDFRKQIIGLTALVQDTLALDPFSEQ